MFNKSLLPALHMVLSSLTSQMSSYFVQLFDNLLSLKIFELWALRIKIILSAFVWIHLKLLSLNKALWNQQSHYCSAEKMSPFDSLYWSETEVLLYFILSTFAKEDFPCNTFLAIKLNCFWQEWHRKQPCDGRPSISFPLNANVSSMEVGYPLSLIKQSACIFGHTWFLLGPFSTLYLFYCCHSLPNLLPYPCLKAGAEAKWLKSPLDALPFLWSRPSNHETFLLHRLSMWMWQQYGTLQCQYAVEDDTWDETDINAWLTTFSKTNATNDASVVSRLKVLHPHL